MCAKVRKREDVNMVKALSDVEKSFDKINNVTKKWDVWKPGWFVSGLYHPQGIAISSDKYYVSHNGVKDGYIYVFEKENSENKNELENKRKIIIGDKYNHPGTIQIANHLLLVTLQRQEGKKYPGTKVLLFDLEKWEKNQMNY